jgi:hypothetical protein
MARATSAGAAFGGWLLILSSAAGLGVSIFDYFGDIGIRGTAGVLLVIVSTALILGASLIIALASVREWIGVVLMTLIFLGIVGTGLAAYFLEAKWLLASMAVALIAWFVRAAFATEAERQSRTLRAQAGYLS